MEFSWLGDSLVRVSESRLGIARLLVKQGFSADSADVLKVLGLDAQAAREAEELEDLRRRAKRERGQLPEGKPLESRRAHKAVQILCAFFYRVTRPTPKLSTGEPLSAKATQFLLSVGVQLELPDQLERHPRAKPIEGVTLDESQAARVRAQVRAVEEGKVFVGAESDRPLPDDCCGATRRNRRRAKEARARLAEEKEYRRQQSLERKAQRVGKQIQNPDGVKPLPLHEGRKARAITRDRAEMVRFLQSLPAPMRALLMVALRQSGQRGLFAPAAVMLCAYFAYLFFQSASARASMRRDGFDRAVEGLPREALAASFVWNATTESPYCANTLSRWTALLEETGLVQRETPNGQGDAYRGTSGWVLNVYRFATLQKLAEMMKQLGITASNLEVAPIAVEASAQPP